MRKLYLTVLFSKPPQELTPLLEQALRFQGLTTHVEQQDTNTYLILLGERVIMKIESYDLPDWSKLTLYTKDSRVVEALFSVARVLKG